MVWVLELGMRLIRSTLHVAELPYIYLFLPLYRRFLRPPLGILMTKKQKHDGKTPGGSSETKQMKQTHFRDNNAVMTKETPSKMGNQRQTSLPYVTGPSHTASLERTFTDPPANYSAMSLEEKRKHYACGNKYVTASSEDLPRWDSEHDSVEPSLRILDRVEPSKMNADLNHKVCLVKQDITRLELDAIVNAANERLLGGGGVDGSIHRAAGPQLKEECRKLDGCPTGDAKITGGHKLPAKHVIHTVGPMNRSEKLLRSCYENCFKIMLERKLRSIAFCCISTGIYGYPNEEAASVALSVTREYLEKYKSNIDLVVFCCFLDTDYRIYKELMTHVYFPKHSLPQAVPISSSHSKQVYTENVSSPEGAAGNEDEGSPVSDQEFHHT